MFYNYCKIFHILSAAILVASIAYCYKLWRFMQPKEVGVVAERIQNQTWLLIIPAALMQLASGFTMISLKHYRLSQLWLTGSVVGFIGVIGSWIGFVYFLLLSQQLVSNDHRPGQVTVKYQFFRRIQSTLLIVC